MSLKRTQSELGVLDPDTYANGDPNTYGLPLDAYKYLRDEEPISLHVFPDDPLLLDRIWVVSRHEDVVAIDRDPVTYAPNRGVVNFWAFAPIGEQVEADAMLTQVGSKHWATRRIVNPAFIPPAVHALEERFRRYAADVIEQALTKDEPFNFITEIAHLMPMQALGDVLGVPEEDRVEFFHMVDQLAAPFDTRITPSFDDVMRAIVDLNSYALKLEARRREEPGDDVMSMLAAARLPEGEIRGNVILLASGAAESTRTCLGHGLHELLRRPEQMAWLREHADNIPLRAAQEIIRISSPFTHLCRVVTRDVELHSVELKEGDVVAMLFAAANFDERVLENPDEFDLARDPNPHLSFGAGPHMCIGKHVAAFEIKILLEELLQRTRDIRPVGPVSYVRDAYSRGVYELPVEMTRA